MQTALFDIETNGLLEQLTTIHSLVIKIYETGTVYSCCPCFNTLLPKSGVTYASVEEGLQILKDSDLVVGHNIIKFDLPAIKKLYPDFNIPIDKVRDTLLYSRLVYPDMSDRDTGLLKAKKMPRKLRGAHGLEAWGYRLKLNKGDYAKEREAELKERLADTEERLPTKEEIIDYVWGTWNLSMQDYCELDVAVTEKLWDKLNTTKVPERAIELEHWFCFIMSLQERFGYRFDVKAAVALYSELSEERTLIDAELSKAFKPWYVSAGLFTPKSDSPAYGYTKGSQFCKVKLQDFNPASRQQIGDRLIKIYGWKPKDFTPSGLPKIDEKVLGKLPYPPAKALAKRFLIEKRIGQVAEGKQAWLKLERNGRIHGSVNTIGAVTGRCTHSHPNVAQVPSPRALYGAQCRAMFTVDEGFKQVGADASGLELRCLAHYMARYDGGAYAKVILEGDIHSANACALFGYEYDTFVNCREDKDTLLIDVANDHKGAGAFLKNLSAGKRKEVTLHDFYESLRGNTKTFIYAFL